MDDNFLYGEETVEESLDFDGILEEFDVTSGILLNKHKSNIYFFHTPQPIQSFLYWVLGFSIVTFPSKYMGVPIPANPLCISPWKYLCAKIHKKVANKTF